MKKYLEKILSKLPSRIRITSKISYELVFIERFENDESCVGETRFDVKQIVIKKNEPVTETVKTIIHEIFHAISEEYNIQLTENQVKALEKGLFTVLRINNLFRAVSKIL
jgi:uncharacterized protein YpuA (DUF1002 family)